MIIGITGKRLSGKTTVAEYLREKYGFLVLDFSQDVLKPVLIKLKKDLTRQSYTELAVEMSRKHGLFEIVRLLCKKISPGKNYVIAGVRAPEQACYLRQTFGKDFILISIEADEETRFARVKLRKDSKDSGTTIEDFVKSEKLPTEIRIPKTMKMADFSINNNDTREKLNKAVDKMMRKVVQQ